MTKPHSSATGNMSADALLAFETYDAIVDGFDWQIPDRTNIAAQVFDRWSQDRGRVALFVEHQDGSRTVWTYWELIRLAKRYANYLTSLGIASEDRVALVMAQGAELAALHLAVYSVGATALPMSSLYGPDTYMHILSNSGARAIVVADEFAGAIRQVRGDLPDLEFVVVHGDSRPDELSLAEAARDTRRVRCTPIEFSMGTC